MPDQPGLFTPVKVGSLELPNRIVMSPMFGDNYPSPLATIIFPHLIPA